MLQVQVASVRGLLRPLTGEGREKPTEEKLWPRTHIHSNTSMCSTQHPLCSDGTVRGQTGITAYRGHFPASPADPAQLGSCVMVHRVGWCVGLGVLRDLWDRIGVADSFTLWYHKTKEKGVPLTRSHDAAPT